MVSTTGAFIADRTSDVDMLLAILAGVAAAVLPAHRASRLDVLGALACE